MSAKASTAGESTDVLSCGTGSLAVIAACRVEGPWPLLPLSDSFSTERVTAWSTTASFSSIKAGSMIGSSAAASGHRRRHAWRQSRKSVWRLAMARQTWCRFMGNSRLDM